MNYCPYAHQEAREKKLRETPENQEPQEKMDARRQQLVLDNMDLVSKITGKYYKKFGKVIAREELYSTISCALVHSALRFDFSLEKCFRKFASGRLHGSVIDYIRSVKNWGRQHSKTDNLLKKVGYLGDNVDIAHSQQRQESFFETDVFFEEIRHCLDDYEYQIVRLVFFEDLSLREIAKRIGDKFNKVDHTYRVAREKMKLFFASIEYDPKSHWAPLFWMYDMKDVTEAKNSWQQEIRDRIFRKQQREAKESTD